MQTPPPTVTLLEGPWPAGGHVAPGGPARLLRRPGLDVVKLSVGPMDNDAYLLTCRSTGERLLIDAAAEPERLLALLARDAELDGHGDGLAHVVTTHAHHDHVGALAALFAATGARTAAGAEDAAALPVPVDRELAHGDRLVLGAQELEVIALRGHTPGSIALRWAGPGGDQLFTGDSLFPGGVGATGGDPERFELLLGDVVSRLFDRLGDDTLVHPGHGDATTLGAERPALPAWRDRGW